MVQGIIGKAKKMKTKFIPVSKPFLNPRGRRYLMDAYDSGWVSSAGPYIERFERAFARFARTRYAAACSSGTNALILALRALKVGPGDEVIVPEFTMVASAWAVSVVGAQPVFVDCRDDLNIDPEKIEKAITKRTKAIMPVHIYGRACDMKAILTIARKHKLKVIEDSAESHGVAPTGDIACFSFYGNKIVTAGEGGICATNDKNLDKRIKWLRSMAFDPKHTFLHHELGYNFRMTNLQAALALSQVEALPTIMKKRRAIEKTYDRLLAPLYGKELIRMPKRAVLWFYDIVLRDARKRDALCAFLEKRGIQTRVFFKPMSMQPMYRNAKYKKTHAYDFSRRGLYLPTFAGMSKAEIGRIAEVIRDFFKG